MHHLSMACDRWRLYVERVYKFVIEKKKKQKSETTSKNQLNIPICPYKRNIKKEKKGGEIKKVAYP